MKITPVATSQNTVGAIEGGSVEPRRMVFETNRTPGYVPEAAAQVEELPSTTGNAQADKINNSEEADSEAIKPLSPQYAALAKQRRALQQEREAFEKERASSTAGKIDVTQLKTEPLRVLLENGVTYEQLTQAILNDQGNSDINLLKAEIKALKEGMDQKLTDRDVQAKQQVLAEMQREAMKLAADNKFELVREMKKVPQVIKFIDDWYTQTGEVLPVQDAMQLAEDELLKQNLRLTSFKKVQEKFAPPAPQSQQAQRMRTLTNRDTASPPISAKSRALAAFYGQLKK